MRIRGGDFCYLLSGRLLVVGWIVELIMYLIGYQVTALRSSNLLKSHGVMSYTLYLTQRLRECAPV